MNKSLTVAVFPTIARTHATDSAVQGRTVSVLPSRNNRVMDASYVKLKRPASCERNIHHI